MGHMSQSKLDLVMAATREIEELKRKLDEAKGRLEQLINTPGIPTSSPAPTMTWPTSDIRRSSKPGSVNIAERVMTYLKAHPGQTVPEVMTALDLRHRETAVRSALKKYKSKGKAENRNGTWYARK